MTVLFPQHGFITIRGSSPGPSPVFLLINLSYRLLGNVFSPCPPNNYPKSFYFSPPWTLPVFCLAYIVRLEVHIAFKPFEMADYVKNDSPLSWSYFVICIAPTRHIVPSYLPLDDFHPLKETVDTCPLPFRTTPLFFCYLHFSPPSFR